MSVVKVRPNEIQVGAALPWPVYDVHNRLLLQRGEVIASQRQMDTLLTRGLYRGATAEPVVTANAVPETRIEPYEAFDEFTRRLNNVFAGLEHNRPDAQTHLERLCMDLERLCMTDMNAALGAVHTYRHPRYSLVHPLHVAVLCYFIAERLNYSPERVRALLGAALTENIGMLNMQDELQKQEDPLSEEQRTMIRRHPERGVEILQRAGIDNAVWLETVLHHHERADGSGYPHGKTTAVPEEALVLALADRYAAMISGRDYRAPLPGPFALRELFIDRGGQFPEELCVSFIKALGIYPPGSMVRLANGEVGVVVRRGEGALWRPMVHSLLDRDGQAYIRPRPRDTNEPRYAIRGLYSRGPELRFNFQALWQVE